MICVASLAVQCDLAKMLLVRQQLIDADEPLPVVQNDCFLISILNSFLMAYGGSAGIGRGVAAMALQ